MKPITPLSLLSIISLLAPESTTVSASSFYTASYNFQLHRFPLQVQGRTVNKVILDLNCAPQGCGTLTFAHFYVGFSRVQNNNDLRVLPCTTLDKGFEHLLRLKVDPYLRAWFASMDSDGSWKPHLVRS